MLRKRIIFSLIYSDGFFNQSRNFRLQKVGNLRWLEKNYKFQDVSRSLDELIVINASKVDKNIEKFAITLETLVDSIFIPITAGGGIRCLSHAKVLFDSGADKILLNTTLHTDKQLVRDLVDKYGSQSIVASIDYKIISNEPRVYIEDGSKELDINLKDYLEDILRLNVGEIYFNSIDQDGTGFGYDLDTFLGLKNNINIPIILAGGAGNEKHLSSGLELDSVDAVATANLFNFIGDGIPKARQALLDKGINIACWH